MGKEGRKERIREGDSERQRDKHSDRQTDRQRQTERETETVFAEQGRQLRAHSCCYDDVCRQISFPLPNQADGKFTGQNSPQTPKGE